MTIKLETQLFRVVAKTQQPELKVFGSNKVLNFTLVPIYSKDGEATPWIKGELWNKDAEKWENNLHHSDVLMLSGSLTINDNKNSTEETKLMPYFNLRIDGFNMRKVTVEKTVASNQEATQATEDVIAARIAANSDDEDSVPDELDF
jgi:single-stranded DNA-binding protein